MRSVCTHTRVLAPRQARFFFNLQDDHDEP